MINKEIFTSKPGINVFNFYLVTYFIFFKKILYPYYVFQPIQAVRNRLEPV